MPVGDLGEVNIAVVDLPPEHLALQGIQPVVVLGMVCHFMAVRDHAPNQVGPLAHAPANYEECDLYALLFKDIQKLDAGRLMRTVIDGEGDLLEIAVAMLEDARRRIVKVLLLPPLDPVGWIDKIANRLGAVFIPPETKAD